MGRGWRRGGRGRGGGVGRSEGRRRREWIGEKEEGSDRRGIGWKGGCMGWDCEGMG